jgi:carbon-monoxide dehydrogenase medium subunit
LFAREAAKLLVNARPSDESFQRAATAAMAAAQPISDVRGSAEFRRELVGVLTKRSLQSARERASGR